MPRSPDKRSFTEHEPLPYYVAASYLTRAEAQQPYEKVQEIIHQPHHDIELSGFRYERKPHDPTAPPLSRPWHVVVIGEQPPEVVEQQLREAMGSGEFTTLPLESIVTLAKRRKEAAKTGGWIEGHYGEGLTMHEAQVHMQRRNPKKDKLKRKMQDKSRRRNRGK